MCAHVNKHASGVHLCKGVCVCMHACLGMVVRACVCVHMGVSVYICAFIGTPVVSTLHTLVVQCASPKDT